MAHNRFDGRIALVTGGTSGMGLATARRLRDEGARVIVTGRDPARLAAAAQELGPEALTIAAETTDLDALFDTIRNRYGRLDVLFVNAGIGFFPPTDAVTEADFDRVVGVNIKGVFFTIQPGLVRGVVHHRSGPARRRRLGGPGSGRGNLTSRSAVVTAERGRALLQD
ncbi:SDR family NAD(P)-dependent oxidoreductase [Nocardia sp. BSTN01]|uniref:SDR family NAD(P)-dependent oxidoreductase n=1 Tax=Nocardia sp. BSTN01 TaxID=2783665 RepID=UPI00189064F3|nr:SDR family NAD(P)-dependent oxidoreductase [Nocardia sp. BSTN01]MBF4999159.1 SDR family NAD(P)-dependent oxidoreductase [Nocardia sp. BSTN01]